MNGLAVKNIFMEKSLMNILGQGFRSLIRERSFSLLRERGEMRCTRQRSTGK